MLVAVRIAALITAGSDENVDAPELKLLLAIPEAKPPIPAPASWSTFRIVDNVVPKASFNSSS